MLEVVLIVAGIAAWIVILFTGRLPQGLFEALLLALRYSTRLSAYQLLLSDRFPWFQPEDAAP